MMKKTLMSVLFVVTLLVGAGICLGSDIHKAVGRGDLKQVKALLQNNPELVNAKAEKSGWTPLHLAAFVGKLEIAKLLIAHGADVNAVYDDELTPLEDKTTPLHFAARYEHLEVANVLIEKGANVNAKDVYQKTPLHEAVFNGKTMMAKLLVKNDAEINAKDSSGSTPLHSAVGRGYTETAKFLIKQ
jgi:ankyrin repeat protein